jgi:chromosome partitioning protein
VHNLYIQPKILWTHFIKLIKLKMRIIALANQKGGVGKTTSVVNIGVGLAKLRYRVLLVDLDPQHSLTTSFGINLNKKQSTIINVLSGEISPKEAIIEKNNLNILPASDDLGILANKLSSSNANENILQNCLTRIGNYDFVIFDCPPNLGPLTINALNMVREVFVPLQPEFLSLSGLKKVIDIVKYAQRNLNPKIRISGLIVTQFDRRLKLHNEVIIKLRSYFGERMFKTVIRRNISLAEATSFGQSIFAYAPESYGAMDYINLCREILKMRGNHGKEFKAKP